ncbi:hypothetical protein A1F94_013209 [Pyrenophora tritici-repentis]|nr:hypothetical protein A1F94_013209 [Pyrenophora tritici-repentis]
MPSKRIAATSTAWPKSVEKFGAFDDSVAASDPHNLGQDPGNRPEASAPAALSPWDKEETIELEKKMKEDFVAKERENAEARVREEALAEIQQLGAERGTIAQLQEQDVAVASSVVTKDEADKFEVESMWDSWEQERLEREEQERIAAEETCQHGTSVHKAARIAAEEEEACCIAKEEAKASSGWGMFGLAKKKESTKQKRMREAKEKKEREEQEQLEEEPPPPDSEPEPVVDEPSPAKEEDPWGGGWGATAAGTKKKKGGDKEAKLKEEEDVKRQKEEEEAAEIRRQEKEEAERLRPEEEEAELKKMEEEDAAAAAEAGVSSFDSAIDTSATSNDDECELRSEHLSRDDGWQNCVPVRPPFNVCYKNGSGLPNPDQTFDLEATRKIMLAMGVNNEFIAQQ